jgi:GT2 family glycosyltransferase
VSTVGSPAVLPGSPTVVLLGMMTKIPVAGVVWQVVHYLEGFRRLGFDPWYVEAHARTPSMFMARESDDGSRAAAEFLERTLGRFGFTDRWAYHALHDDGAVHGTSEGELRGLYRRAALIVNLHGGTQPTDELAATGRLVYLETDPCQLQVELHEGNRSTEAFLDAHVAWFTFGENWGRAGNPLPAAGRYPFRPTRQPVLLDLWQTREPPGGAFTTVANWRQRWREVHLDGAVYTWSKDLEFARVERLPERTGASFELALSGHEPDDVARLRELGWLTREALPMSLDPDRYRSYLRRSRAEFTVAKDQNVRLRSGWFSDRSATYLAAGRPVITQDTGLTDVYPTGEGLHVWSDLDDAAAAVDRVLSRPAAESAAAAEIAREYLAHDRVLGALLADLGLGPRPQRHHPGAADGPQATPWPPDLPLVPRSRRPLVLAGDAEARILAAPLPRPLPAVGPRAPVASVVVPVCDNLALTRLSLESMLDDRRFRDLELVVVDNGSVDATPTYLRHLAEATGNVVVVRHERNLGYAAAVNRGVEASTGPVVVLCNNDVVVAPGWLDRLLAHLGDGVGLVAPVTDGAPGAARVPRSWTTYGEFLVAAAARARECAGRSRTVERITYCCVAIPREAWDAVGPLDTGYGIGLFEDDDHVERLRRAGFDLRVADDVLVAHLGEATLGTLAPSGAYGELFHANRARFERIWGRPWAPHPCPPDEDYAAVVARLRDLVEQHVPATATVAVVSKGDPALVDLAGRPGLHVPGDDTGAWCGFHPADGSAAVDAVDRAVTDGARFLVLPRPQAWWLERYAELREHLAARFRTVADDPAGVLYERVEA